MSFSFHFIARSRPHALKKLDRITHVPEAVRSFVILAINAMPDVDDARVIEVRASGQLKPADATYSADSASALIEVRSIAATD
ncbi:hypothetical protein [Nitrobacter winogradskyi]|uniref:Uncharacterized protein n=2 Tax=Nitrobacter winogradskyi TaxID=913 RepID=A0ACC6AHN5_NITWI|nr:hypothetical protein [Nitrobacter winogradskyi]MCP1998791.1 hypothetical protein [Nitrobacter winogradskyi]GEC14287.1 hypothetical protein NWI01_01790 [Nitrobacter winogradskyi]